MKITRACDYAIKALVQISNTEQGTLSLRHELAETANVPNSFLGKILQDLARAGILISGRGRKGGFRLGRIPSEITVYDIIIAVEGKIVVADCLIDLDICSDVDTCKIRSVWNNLQANLTEKLKGITLEELR
jgi:Rrf2 family protein